MADLETLIAEAARTGRLTALTLWPTGSGQWQANVRRKHPDGKEGWACVTCTDPAAGIKDALSRPTEVKAVWEQDRSPVSGRAPRNAEPAPAAKPAAPPPPADDPEDIFG